MWPTVWPGVAMALTPGARSALTLRRASVLQVADSSAPVPSPIVISNGTGQPRQRCSHRLVPARVARVGPAQQDFATLQMAHAYEQATQWHTRRPAL